LAHVGSKLSDSIARGAHRFALSDGRLARAGRRFVGTPPPTEAPKKEHLLFLRRYYLRMLPLALVAYAAVAIVLPTPWAWAVPVGGTLLWLQGFVSLSVRIRRENRRGDASGSAT
jgi:hypothetical protein